MSKLRVAQVNLCALFGPAMLDKNPNGGMVKLKRLCWWCNSRLSATSHAVLPSGQWVHKMCERIASDSFKRITAQPRNADEMDALIEDQLGSD